MTEKKSNYKSIIIGLAIGVICLVAITVAIISNSNNGKYKLTDDEHAAAHGMMAGILTTILQNDGVRSISASDCRTFKTIAQKYKKDSDWFASPFCAGNVKANYESTDSSKTIILTDGKYIARYSFDNDLWFLTDFSFVAGEGPYYRVPVTND